MQNLIYRATDGPILGGNAISTTANGNNILVHVSDCRRLR
jgi:hypothetical protein